MNKFFVALFINDRFCQYNIDVLIQNSTNGYVDENLVFGQKNVYFPVQIVGDAYCLQKKDAAWTVKHQDREIGDGKPLAHGDYVTFSKDDVVYAALVLAYSCLTLSQKVYRLDRDPVWIGRSEEMHVVFDTNANISRKCAAIRWDESGTHYLEDLSGKTSLYVNGYRETSKALCAGDRIYVMGNTITYYPHMLILSAAVKTNRLAEVTELETLSAVDDKAMPPFVRTPRIMKSLSGGKITIDAPPAPQKSKELPFILTAGPSLTMSFAMLASVGTTIANALDGGGVGSLITSSVMAVSMLLGALLWPGLLRSYNKRQEEANEIQRRNKYTAYLEEKEKEIREKYERNIRVYQETLMPSPEALKRFILEQNRRLWERRPVDEDFLSIRLGVGDKAFEVEVQAPHKGFTLQDDPMIEEAIALKNKYQTLSPVPIALSLTDKRVVGVVGSTMDLFHTIVTNIVALHAYDEVKIVLVYSAADQNLLEWANDLPHVWSSDRSQRYVATTKDEAKAMFSALDEQITEREELLKKDDARTPTFVVLVLDETLVEDVPFKRYLINPDNRVGVSTVFFGKRFSNIPKECVAIIQKDTEVCGFYAKNENDNHFISFTADVVSRDMAKEIAVGINRITVKTEKKKARVPDRVTFLDMYRVGNVDALTIANHWGTNVSEKSLAAPIGIKAGGEIFELDIHEKYHGSHGLVAGTTGSGKSEFLQAYILSMMIRYSPNEVAFVLVDFKGGDMARPFLKAPHLSATISNLSGNALHRALISLEAEVKNRQSIFNRSAEALGVDKMDINAYHKYFKDKKLVVPLPHLIIVIDEFAQLKSQHPEFMTKLVDIAQVGRSLGIHLILATQRPSGVVDPQIWSNAKFKVCLKVLDKQDSMDMINRPEAALIKQPGRAYVQVGYDEVFEQIQSGYSGADYIEQESYVDEESVSVSMVNWPAEKIRAVKRSLKDKKSDRTQLEVIVSRIAAIGDEQGLSVKKLWLPPLAASLRLETCGMDTTFDAKRWDTQVYGDVLCGMADLPRIQEQKPYHVNFLKNGHLAIYGSSGTGKSTLIQTILFSMALQYSPEKLNVFVMDFDGGSLASVASMPHCAKYASDGDEPSVEAILGTIRRLIAERRRIFTQKHCANFESFLACSDEPMPMILLVLDNYALFREKMYKSEDVLVQLISAARSCGIYLIVTGNSKGAVYYKLSEQISEKIVLNMNDSGAYRDILNVSNSLVPEQGKGRGLVLVDGAVAEVQFAVPYDTVSESNRTGRIQKTYALMADRAQRAVVSLDAGLPPLDSPQALTSLNVYESSMPALNAVVPSDTVMVLGKDTLTGETKGFDLSETDKLFIGTRGQQNVVRRIVNPFAQDSVMRVCLVTSKDTEGFNERVEIVQDLDAFVEELLAASEIDKSNTVVVIDGFCDFFDRISDEALLLLEKEINAGTSIRFVTFDAMKRLDDYKDTGLYALLVHTSQGAIVGGGIDNALASYLFTEIYQIPSRFREKRLDEKEATVYAKDRLAYITIGG